jgi:hypothetical protein
MGLTFQVGASDQVILEPAASALARHLRERYPDCGAGPSEREPWYSTELGWSGWESLQVRVQAVLGEGSAPHFCSMEAWFGAYLPTEIEPDVINAEESDTPLSVASLPCLVDELKRFASVAGLPADLLGLQTLAAKYDDDDLCDEDMDLQTYAQLLQGAMIAIERNQPLWIVK